MKLPRSTENKITEDKDGKKVPQLGITEAISVHCNIVNNDSPEDWKLLYLFVPMNSLIIYWKFHQQILYF